MKNFQDFLKLHQLVLFCAFLLNSVLSHAQIASKVGLNYRKVIFSTEEGSYMNVDVSPDGNKILFDLLGDIYYLPIKGGSARQLTYGTALHLRPVWSPDGKHFAFLTDSTGALHLAVRTIATGKTIVLGKHDIPIADRAEISWSIDGSRVYSGNWMYNLNHKNDNGIFQETQFICGNRETFTKFFIEGNKLYKLVPNTTKKHLISSFAKSGSSIMVSPDGKYWGEISNEKYLSIIIRNCSNNTIYFTQVISSKDHLGRFPLVNPRFCFSPDSECIYLNFQGKIHRINLKTGEDSIIPFHARVCSKINDITYNKFKIDYQNNVVRYIRSTKQNPKSDQLAFCALNKIYISDANGKHIKPLIDQPFSQFQPAWSPDGRAIAYVTWQDTIGGALWKYDQDGHSPVKLSNLPGQYQRPIWSPDGKFLAVIRSESQSINNDRDNPGKGMLEFWSSDGNGLINQVQDSVPLWNNLSFTSDGKKIYYTPKKTDSDLYPVIVTKDIETGKIKPWLFGFNNLKSAQIAISPQQQFLVYSLSEDLYLLPLSFSQTILSINKSRPLGIKFAKGIDPSFSADGKKICWTYSNEYKSIEVREIISIASRSSPGLFYSDNQLSSWFSIKIEPSSIKLDIPLKVKYGDGCVVLQHIKIITARDNEIIEDGNIVVQNGRIKAIGEKLLNIPIGAKIIDCRGLTVMPGLVDLHNHMRLPPNIFPNQSWIYLANLAFGVTTTRDPSSNYDSFGYSELLKAGEMIGPRLFTVGKPARLGDIVSFDSLSDAIELVKKRKAMGGIAIKQYDLPVRQQRQWLSQAVKSQGLNMTNEGSQDWLHDLAMIKDGSTGIEHSPLWGDVYNDVIKFISKSKVTLTPTLQVGYASAPAKEYFKYKYWRFDPKLEHFTFSDPTQPGPTSNGAESIETVRNTKDLDTINPSFIYPSSILTKISQMGGNIGIGSHGNNPGIGAHNEMWALKSGGVSNLEVIKQATILGAHALGLDSDLGSIEVGKIADMIFLAKDPLLDIHNTRYIKYVMKDGILYEGDTLDQIWPNQVKCPEWKLKNIIN